MDDVLARLDAEIAAQEHILSGLRLARDIVAGPRHAPPAVAPAATKSPQMIEGPAPDRSSGRKGGAVETLVYEINDVNVEVSQPQFDILKSLFDADGAWVPGPQLARTVGSAYKVKYHINQLRQLLKPAKARIDGARRQGFRIVTDD